jgi:hypothetical protein
MPSWDSRSPNLVFLVGGSVIFHHTKGYNLYSPCGKMGRSPSAFRVAGALHNVQPQPRRAKAKAPPGRHRRWPPNPQTADRRPQTAADHTLLSQSHLGSESSERRCRPDLSLQWPGRTLGGVTQTDCRLRLDQVSRPHGFRRAQRQSWTCRNQAGRLQESDTSAAFDLETQLDVESGFLLFAIWAGRCAWGARGAFVCPLGICNICNEQCPCFGLWTRRSPSTTTLLRIPHAQEIEAE